MLIFSGILKHVFKQAFTCLRRVGDFSFDGTGTVGSSYHSLGIDTLIGHMTKLNKWTIVVL